MTTKLRRIGNSLGIIIPGRMIEEAGLSESDHVRLSCNDGRIVIEKITVRPSYKLTDLLNQRPPSKAK